MAIYRILHGWRDLPVGVVLFTDDVDRNHDGAKFSTPVFVLHQSFWKFCVHLYLGFAALHPELHLPHAVAVHGLHSLVGRNQSPSEFFRQFHMFYDVGNGRYSTTAAVDCIWNVMAHAQKPDLVFQRNGRAHLNRRGSQFSRLLAVEECRSAVVMVVRMDRTCSEAECKSVTYFISLFPLHFPSHASPCIIRFQMSSTTFIAETVYEMHVGMFFICKRVRHFDYPTVWQHSHTATAASRDSMQAGTELRYSIAVLAGLSANHPLFIQWRLHLSVWTTATYTVDLKSTCHSVFSADGNWTVLFRYKGMTVMLKPVQCRASFLSGSWILFVYFR